MNATANGRAAILGNGSRKPAPMTIQAANIPPELRELSRWLCWNWELDQAANGGAGKWTKPPVSAMGGKGSSTDETTWSDFSTALAAVEAGEADGIGIALGDLGDGRILTGVDADDCRNPLTGNLTIDAQAVLSLVNSYAEVSPTGTGAKILCYGTLPKGRRSRGRYECYQAGRYFTVTGRKLPASRVSLREATPELAKFHATFIEPPAVPANLPERNGTIDTALAVEALNALNPSRADSYEDWLMVGMALHSADPRLLDEWDHWSAQSSKYAAGVCHDKWQSFNGSGVGLGSLIHWARQDGWTLPRREASGDKCTDAANAIRFAAQHGDRVRYVHKWNKFLAFTGRRWEYDDSGEVMRLAKRTADAIYREAAEARDANEQKALGAWAKTSHSRPRLEAMIELAKSEHPIPISPESVDADPWLLNCENKTVELRTGKLRPHDPSDLITKSTGVEYPDEPGVDAILWGEFLDDIFDRDVELIRFLKRLMGSALPGEVLEHLLPIFHGTGANGKSVFIGAVQAAMGDYAMSAPPGLLMAKRTEQHPTELADLFGRRLVVISETNDSQRLDEGLVKTITGGDVIRARRMREDHWEFKPSHQAVLVTNHKPIVRGTDYAIWRRLRLVPFAVTIPEDRQDKQLAHKLRNELGAILAWMVAGCIEWQRDGLTAPAKVMAATNTYKSESDTFALWFAEVCVADTGAEWKAGLAFGSYRHWCEESNERPLTTVKFGERVLAQGFTRTPRRRDGYYYLGFKHLGASGEECEQCEGLPG